MFFFSKISGRHGSVISAPAANRNLTDFRVKIFCAFYITQVYTGNLSDVFGPIRGTDGPCSYQAALTTFGARSCNVWGAET